MTKYKELTIAEINIESKLHPCAVSVHLKWKYIEKKAENISKLAIFNYINPLSLNKLE